MVTIEPFGMGSINPVRNVQCPIQAKEEDKFAGQVFHQTIFPKHIKLWEDGNGLQINGTGPEEFHQLERMPSTAA
eukprot:scaffold386_cov246-Chaetoceros_neogracile.AAC.8